MKHCWQKVLLFGILIHLLMPVSFCQPGFDPDSLVVSELAKEDYNPYQSLYSMNSWTVPVPDHAGMPHKDGHVIQIIADGGNGIQDPPNADGSPGGDDSLAIGNFNFQFVNGEKHAGEGLGAGMFAGMMYFVPYKANTVLYLRIWEGSDATAAEYYQDSEEHTTFRGNRGGAMLTLRSEYLEDVDWRFGPSVRVVHKK